MTGIAEAGAGKQSHERAVDIVSRCLSVSVLIALVFATFRIFHGANIPFLAFSLAGVPLIQFSYQRRIWTGLLTVVNAILLYAAYAWSGGMPGQYSGAGVVGTLAFLGLGSLLTMGLQAFRRTEALRPLLLASLCPGLMIVTNFALYASIALQPQVFDLYLYKFDALLGGQASFIAGQWFIAAPALQQTCFFVYASLPLAEVVLLWLYWKGQRMPANPVVTFVIAGVAGFLLYQICPAMGPVHVFAQDFPQHVLAAPAPHAIALNNAPRNAMPSLHTAWAILIWWSLRFSQKWIRAAAAAFLTLTLMATLGFGEHYLIDLVVAVPFTLAVQAASTRQLASATGWISLTILWCVYLRWGLLALPISGVAAGMLVFGTLAIPMVQWAIAKVTRATAGAATLVECDSHPSASLR